MLDVGALDGVVYTHWRSLQSGFVNSPANVAELHARFASFEIWVDGERRLVKALNVFATLYAVIYFFHEFLDGVIFIFFGF